MNESTKGDQQTNTTALLNVKNLTHWFEDEKKPILQDVSLTVNKNESIALTGRSGSGKTTLLHLISGLKLPQAGKVELDGIDLHKADSQTLNGIRNQKMGFVYQTHYLFKDFNALENIALAAKINQLSFADAKAKAFACMESIDIRHLADKMPSCLSGGEKQRVAIARAIVNNPDILFADEPTGNLDDENTDIIMSHIHNLQNQNTMSIIIATHDSKITNNFNHIINLSDKTVTA